MLRTTKENGVLIPPLEHMLRANVVCRMHAWTLGWSLGNQTGEPTHQHNRGERDAEHADRQVQGDPNHVGLHLRRVEDPLVRHQPQRESICSWLAVCCGVGQRSSVLQCVGRCGVVWCMWTYVWCGAQEQMCDRHAYQ
jgi:hypothetical protein